MPGILLLSVLGDSHATLFLWFPVPLGRKSDFANIRQARQTGTFELLALDSGDCPACEGVGIEKVESRNPGRPIFSPGDFGTVGVPEKFVKIFVLIFQPLFLCTMLPLSERLFEDSLGAQKIHRTPSPNRLGAHRQMRVFFAQLPAAPWITLADKQMPCRAPSTMP